MSKDFYIMDAKDLWLWILVIIIFSVIIFGCIFQEISELRRLMTIKPVTTDTPDISNAKWKCVEYDIPEDLFKVTIGNETKKEIYYELTEEEVFNKLDEHNCFYSIFVLGGDRKFGSEEKHFYINYIYDCDYGLEMTIEVDRYIDCIDWRLSKK